MAFSINLRPPSWLQRAFTPDAQLRTALQGILRDAGVAALTLIMTSVLAQLQSSGQSATVSTSPTTPNGAGDSAQAAG